MALLLTILGWAAWIFGIFVLLGLSLAADAAVGKVFAAVGFILSLIMLFVDVSKLHLLWIAPILFIAGMALSEASHHSGRRVHHNSNEPRVELSDYRKDALRELARQLFDREGVTLLWDDPDDGNGIGATESVNSFSLRAAYRLDRLGEDERTRVWGVLDDTFEVFCEESFEELADRIGISEKDREEFHGQFDPQIAEYGDPDEEFDYDWPDEPSPEDQLRYNLSSFLGDWFKPEDFDKIITWDKAQVDAWLAKYGDV